MSRNYFMDLHRWSSMLHYPICFSWTRPLLDTNSLTYRFNLHNTLLLSKSYNLIPQSHLIPFSFPSYQNFHRSPVNALVRCEALPYTALNHASQTASYHTTQVVKDDATQQYFAQERNVSSQVQRDVKDTSELSEQSLKMDSDDNQLKPDTHGAEPIKGISGKRQREETDGDEDHPIVKSLKQKEIATDDGLISEKLFREGHRLFTHVCSLRQWEYTDFGLEHIENRHHGVELSIMSYNVLSQSLLRDNFYLYNHCESDVLSWDYRKLNLLHEIKMMDADVICLQEVEETHYHDFFKIELSNLGYDGVYKKRTGDKPDGCVIFYRIEKFILNSCKTVEYFKPGIKILDRDNVGIIVLLTPRYSSSKRKLCIANTHLLFNPRRGDIKLAQISLLLAEIDRIARKPKKNSKMSHHPIILCGDFNCEPFCKLYKFLGEGKLNYSGLLAGGISGQRDGLRGPCNVLPKELLPPSLGISEKCRFIDKEELKLEKSFCSNNSSTSLKNPNLTEKSSSSLSDIECNSGYLIHKLKLFSVYKHFLQRAHGAEEVTTYHSKVDATVDYIFYSVKKNKSKNKDSHQNNSSLKEGKLHLLARYGLLSSEELESFGGLPNSGLSSDHLSLMCKFLLS